MITIICKLCGKEFPTKKRGKGTPKFCGVICSNKYSSSLRKKRALVKCLICNKEYEIQQWRIKDRKKYFCSDKCRISYNNKIKKNCAVCHKEFEVCMGRKETAQFCSRPCQAIGIGKWKSKYNKRDKLERLKDRGKALELYGISCEICGWSKVVEVHHIDGNRENHNIDNLCILCPNCHTLTEDKYIKNDHYITKEKMKEMINSVRAGRNKTNS